MTPEQFFNLSLLFWALTLILLIAVIVCNSKSKETLREAKDITAKAKSAVEEMERQRDASLDNYRKEHIEHSMTQINLSEAKMEVQTLKDNLHALADEIVNPAYLPKFRAEENEAVVRVMADYTTLNGDRKIPLIVREFEKGDNFVLAWSKANKLLTALTK